MQRAGRFVPIAGDQWMILDTQFAATDDGTRITISGETFAPEEIPVNDAVGGLFQLKLGEGYVRSEFSVPLVWEGASTELAVVPAADASQGEASDGPRPEPESKGFLPMLFMAFLGGMLLNMPCVLPVLSKDLQPCESAEADASHRQQAGLGYTIGVLGNSSPWVQRCHLKSVMGIQVGWGFQFELPST